MTWAFKRQFLYIIILLLFMGIFGFLIISPSLNKSPTCADGKQNGGETGVDCGGSCLRACFAQVDPISVLWSRSFKVVGGRHNAVAYLENHNKNTAVNKINYRFRFADANNVYIGKRDGSTYVPPSGKFAVFEPAIDVGNSIPVYTTFEFTEVPQWVTVSEEKIRQLQVLISNISINSLDRSTRLSATITNNSLFIIPSVKVIAILYDELGNSLAVSSTYIDVLNREEVKDINFTWPEIIPNRVVAKEIIPIYNIFSVRLK